MAFEKAALVTGGSARLGKELSLHLAQRGHDIALHYRSSKEKAQAAADEIKGKGVDCSLFKADLSFPGEAASLVKGVVGKMPHLNVLVNNASVFEEGLIKETGTELLERQLEVNFKSPFTLMRDFAAAVDEGEIINMVDERVLRNESDHAAYTLSKKALRDLTMMAAREFAPGVRVNAIAPGYILPPSTGNDNMDAVLEKIPLRRKGEVADILKAVDYLLDAGYVTGQVLYVDGGRHV